MSAKERALWVGIRQILIMALGLVEDFLDMPHSIATKRAKAQAAHEGAYNSK